MNPTIEEIPLLELEKISTIKDYQCINIENNLSYHELINHTNGDKINETNFVNNIIKNNITLYFNNQFTPLHNSDETFT
jgi:hypothetical protein